MTRYHTPQLNTVKTNFYLLRLQATGQGELPQVSCDAGTSCTGGIFSECGDLNPDIAAVQFFLPETDANSNPTCNILVNGVEAGSCDAFGFDNACEAGAEWVITCTTNVTCTGNDIVTVNCDGFQESGPCPAAI